MARKENQYRSWCFTKNNYTEDDYGALCAWLEPRVEYAIVGRETGDSGTPHLQGYFRLKVPCRFSTLQNRHLNGYHIEKANGNPGQNRDYCQKQGDYREFGECPERKSKSKSRDTLATEYVSVFKDGLGGITRFAEDNPGCYLFSGHVMYRNALGISPPIERPNIRVRWIHGEPGVGKSRLAHSELPDAYIKEPRTKWWNGYLLERDVIIDDFGPGGIDLNHLLRWFDRYKCIVENKGGMTPLYADNFIVTSNFHPHDCWKDKEGVPHPQMDALYRRIDIIEMTEGAARQ